MMARESSVLVAPRQLRKQHLGFPGSFFMDDNLFYS